ncbi:DUF4253 domain-containing protein [Nocardia asteroides]|uniref:DUF4253 domain-containing protein n=1 Tax=Nocardia asteroides TaxID=1824 RepID=UPI001E4698F9|nr:DUF4253 domain-containing protein [Nocardia asteroides]UGT62437.1 DUF4253 domain-containing protein [Nocardia asteroides]
MTIDTTAPRFIPDPPVPADAGPPGRDAALRELLTADTELGAAGFTPVPGTELDGGSVWVAEVASGYPACDLWRAFRDRFEQTGFRPILIERSTLDHPGEPEAVAGPLNGAAVLTTRDGGDPVRADIDLSDADDPGRYDRGAREAFAYCPDAVHQDYGSLDGVAERLLRPIWRLWWD